MKTLIRKLWPALVLAVALSACVANESGTVTDRKPCKTSSCIYVKRDSDGTVDFSMVGVADYPRCVKGARWPDCKTAGR